MRTKKSWMLPESKRADLGAFFSRLWRLVVAFGSPPDPGDPDDDAYWNALIEVCGQIGQQCDADHDPWAARFLIAVMEGAGNVQRLQDPGGGADRPDRPGGLIEKTAAS